MTIYLETVEDERGDAVEHVWYCSSVCAPDQASAYPCGSESDSPDYCAACGDAIGNPLTGEGVRYARELWERGDQVQRERLARAYSYLFGDSALIAYAVTREEETGEPLPDVYARVIAAVWHGGQSSALYALASTGAILTATDDDDRDTLGELSELISETDEDELRTLRSYVERVGTRGPVEGWDSLHW